MEVQINVGSLFSGIGGMDAGLARAGLKHAFLCEIDEWRRGVLRERFPGVPIYDDVRSIGHVQPDANGRRADAPRSERDFRGRAPSGVDLLCGGFPCQDLSVAGRRAGLTGGERSSLFFEFARVADELVPADGWVLIENVPGLLSSQDGRDFALVLATLAELGFHDLAWRILDSRYFGVPQRRRRVFILGRRASGRGAFEVLLEPESSGRDFEAGGEAGPGTAYTSALGTTRCGGHGLNAEKAAGGQLISVDTYNQTTDRDTFATLRDPNGTFGDALPAVAFALRKDPGGTGQGHNTNYVVPQFVSENQRGEVLETDYAHQLTSGGGGPGQGYAAARTEAGVRRLTPVECERLQGLPDGWTQVPEKAPDSRRYAALGDAVTANVAEWIGRRLLAHVLAEAVRQP